MLFKKITKANKAEMFLQSVEEGSSTACRNPKRRHLSLMRLLNAIQTRIGIILLVLIVLLVLGSITVLPRTIPTESPPEWSPSISFEVTAFIQTADGGFALTGGLKTHHSAGCCLCASRAYEGRDMLLLKTDVNGVIIWNQSYGGSDAENPSALVQTVDGGFALAGWTDSFGEGNKDMWLVKTDANGIMTWNQSYGGPRMDMASALIQTGDGGFALLGYTESFGAENEGMWLVKTDTNGKEQWNHTYRGVDHTYGGVEANSLIETVDGGFLIAGRSIYEDMLLIKTDVTGNLTWYKNYGGPDADNAYALIQTTDGDFALAGYTESFGEGNEDMWLVKTDTNGMMTWNQFYGGLDVDIAYDLVQTVDGGFVLAGTTSSFGIRRTSRHDNRTSNIWLVKTDTNGVILWHQTYGDFYGNFSSEKASVLIQATDGGFLLAGWTDELSLSMLLVKTDANGVMLWHQTYGNSTTQTLSSTPTPGWEPISLLVIAVVLITYFKRRTK